MAINWNIENSFGVDEFGNVYNIGDTFPEVNGEKLVVIMNYRKDDYIVDPVNIPVSWRENNKRTCEKQYLELVREVENDN